jgi:hypothetical protein
MTMPTFDDELKAVLNGFAGQHAPAVARPDAVALRIKHHQRVRAAGMALAIALVLLVVSGVTVFAAGDISRSVTPTKSKQPTDPPTVSWKSLTSATPGHLPEFAPSTNGGGQRIVYGTITMPATPSIQLDFRPKSTDFFIGLDCKGSSTLSGLIYVNGHQIFETACVPDASSGSTLTIEPDAGKTWSAYGVSVGKTTKITASFGTRTSSPDASQTTIKPSSLPGIATLAVYQAVPWSAYPHGPLVQPASTLTHAHTLATIDSADATARITLPRQIQVSILKAGYGLITVSLDSSELDTDGYDNATGSYRSPALDVGKGQLANFRVGQNVTLSLFVFGLSPGQDWRVTVYGS